MGRGTQQGRSLSWATLHSHSRAEACCSKRPIVRLVGSKMEKKSHTHILISCQACARACSFGSSESSMAESS